MARQVEGKVVIVTGGAGGIGSATSRLLTAEGARVVVADIDGAGAEALAHEIGGDAIAVCFDAGDADSVKALVGQTAQHFGRIDVLHNNAAMTGVETRDDVDFLTTKVETWDNAMRINLRSMFVSCQAAIPYMMEQGRGSIINMSTAGAARATSGGAAYLASKAGVASLSRSLAVQFGRHGIRSNSIMPGVIMTPLLKSHISSTLQMLPTMPYFRDGQAEDIARLVLFLGSDASEFINGQALACDGGYLAGEGPVRSKF